MRKTTGNNFVRWQSRETWGRGMQAAEGTLVTIFCKCCRR